MSSKDYNEGWNNAIEKSARIIAAFLKAHYEDYPDDHKSKFCEDFGCCDLESIAILIRSCKV